MNATCIRLTYDQMIESSSELYALGSDAASSDSCSLVEISSNKEKSAASSGSSVPRSNTNSFKSPTRSSADGQPC